MHLHDINQILDAYYNRTLPEITSGSDPEDDDRDIIIYNLAKYTNDNVFLKVTTLEDSYGTMRVVDIKFVEPKERTITSYEII